MSRAIHALSRSAARSALAALLLVVASAHIGSPTAFFAGKAGGYDVQVIVNPPSVIPGIAEITVIVPRDEAAAVRRIVVRPVYWATGAKGAPAGDVMARVPGPEAMYAGKLWFMESGSQSVYVTVEGTRGAGTATIPVAAVATAQLPLGPGLKILLVILGFILFFGMLTIVHAAAGESLVAPGEAPSPARTRRARVISAAALPLLVLVLFGGWRWWSSEARAFQRTLYKPLLAKATVRDAAGARTLRMTITDSAWRAGYITPIMPDHGKMMHLFLVRDGALDAFAHLHPVMVDSNSFETPLPALPAGRYHVYGDIVHQSGFSRTLVDSIVLAAPPSGAPALPDSDDAWLAAATTGATVPLGGGATMTFADAAPGFLANRPVSLRFTVADASGRPAVLEPYMGMTGHAVVVRDDQSVFVHLHPSGTISMAAQQAFALRDRGDTTAKGRLKLDDTAHAMPMPAMRAIGEVAFPYEFPRAGRYHLWVQVRVGGAVRTGAFETEVR